MKNIFFLIVILFSVQIFAQQTHYIPADYSLIQDAIEASEDGDTILVSPGEYFENVLFRGKAVFITSMFHYSGNREDIETTIINGSMPQHPDTASCVLFINDETEASVLKGFTITGGTGTRTYNPNENLYFRTGGGIVISAASPTIVSNIITGNESINQADVTGAGGGGIRVGNGNPIIRNNIISYNTGRYAGGIMIAFCGGMELKNNVIVHNTALGDFNGGGGIYIDWQPVTFINNTIAFNHSGDDGGGMIVTGTTATVKNCIIYGNTCDSQQPQIYLRYGGFANTTYTNIASNWSGEGNIDEDPDFSDTTYYYLNANSTCVDAGNPDPLFNDNENPDQPGYAQPPSLGSITNDMGAYGGPLVEIQNITGIDDDYKTTGAKLVLSNPYRGDGATLHVQEKARVKIELADLYGKTIKVLCDNFYNPGEYEIDIDEYKISGIAIIVMTIGKKHKSYKIVF